MLKKVSLLAALLMLSISAHAADILIRSAGDHERIVFDYDGYRFSEGLLTDTVAQMLVQQLFAEYQIATDVPGSEAFYTVPESEGCALLAIELHLQPEHQPNGPGTGLWVAANAGQPDALAVGNALLSAWSADQPHRERPLYADTVLHDMELPADAYVSAASGEPCPAIHINLDTYSLSDPHLWPMQAQSVWYYAEDVGNAIRRALVTVYGG